ncbi:MAG: class I SAM-dependent methyltransferase [Telmatospirillum sp.]|nr:class I SAM-dependent methyltransferase [Telmatospirillum sp.]
METPAVAPPDGETASQSLPVLGLGLAAGELMLIMPDGAKRHFIGRQPGPRAVLRLNSYRALRRLGLGGAVGFAESYIDGDWDSPDPVSLLELGDVNERALGRALNGHPFLRLMLTLWHRLHDNSRRGSRRNISAHYDLGNAFYAQWLDPGMTYSSALFASPDDSLSEAQDRKYRALAADVGLVPGMRVLEIGCGWGGFAELMARSFGVTVVGLTLSREQHAFASNRIAAAGLSDRVEIRLEDYRDIRGRFDRVMSVEMIEAVGERWWPTYFRTIRDRLVSGGKAGLQAITIADDRFDRYRQGCDFIQRHVFPGGMLPSPTVLDTEAARAGLTLSTSRCFGADYERTLARWDHAFRHSWDQIARLGYDTRFRRLWEFYLAYCRAGFRTGAVDVRHLVLCRD